MDDESIDEALLDVLYETFGRHEGFRVTHAKGVFAHGVFTASAIASDVSRAAHLQGQAVPVVLRFSNFSGIPSTSDDDPMASPRGLALRFLPSGQPFTDLVAHSFDGFPVGNPTDFLGFLRAISASVADPPDPGLLASFLAEHASARRYLEAPKPWTGSYLAERYYGVNTFRFINVSGHEAFGRYRIDPILVAPHASAEAAAAGGNSDALVQDLSRRIDCNQARMTLKLQLPAPGDALDDGSVSWPRTGVHARHEIELGVIVIQSIDVSDRQPMDLGALAFNPGNLIDGLGLSNDPMIPSRQRIYELASRRRQVISR